MKNIIIALSVFFFASCITNKDTQYLQEVKNANYAKYEPADYRIKPGDELRMQLFTVNKDLMRVFSPIQTGLGQSAQQQQGAYLVYNDGTIDLPFIQRVQVQGLTLREAEKVVENEFLDYTKDPVAVNMIVSNRYFYVLGESNKKGQYAIYKNDLNIFEAIAMSGDLSISADRTEVSVIRRDTLGKEEVRTFDLRSKNIVDSDYYYIQPDDIIYAGRSSNSFFKMTSFMTFLGTVTSSFSFLLLVLQ